MSKKLGFIGCGNMAKAMIEGVIKSGVFKSCDIWASDSYEIALQSMKEKWGINVSQNNTDIAKNCHIIFIAVKPNMYKSVCGEIAQSIKEDAIIITIAPGQSVQMVEDYFGKKVKIVRTMPNTPALVQMGMTGMCYNDMLGDDDIALAKSILSSFSRCEVISEKLMDTVVAVSGSSPAYVFMMIEAMADGAVAGGMSRDMAYVFAAQTVMGSAKMVLETGEHPGKLKDMVCSPGGTTIDAVAALEKEGFRSAIITAMDVCRKKADSLK